MSGPEVEFKLSLDLRDRDAFRAHPALAGIEPQIHDLHTTYYDTKSLALARRFLSLRVRTEAGISVQTLKATKRALAGLFRRDEWECPLDTPRPDLTRFAEAEALEALPGKIIGKVLKPRTVTEMRRTGWQLEHGGSLIEIVLDEGTVRTGELSEPFCEVELELKRGEAEPVVALARHLAETVRLRLGVQSKSDRGFALLRGGRPVVAKGEQLDRTMTVGTGFRFLVRDHLRPTGWSKTSIWPEPTTAPRWKTAWRG